MYASDSVLDNLDHVKTLHDVYIYHTCVYVVESVGEVRTFIQ